MSRFIPMSRSDTQSEVEYLAIGAAARRAGVAVETLRRWEGEGRITAERTPGGHRLFRVEDVDALRSPSPTSHEPIAEAGRISVLAAGFLAAAAAALTAAVLVVHAWAPALAQLGELTPPR